MYRTIIPVVPVPSRTLHVVDAQNLAGGPSAEPEIFEQMWCEYVAHGAAVREGDQIIVATSSLAAAASWFAMPQNGIRRYIGDGPNGATLALVDALDITFIARRFDRLSIGSGSAGLAPLALAGRAHGLVVHVVVGRGYLSHELKAACHTRARILQTLDAELDVETPFLLAS